jgi:hypothetical protein
MTTAIVSQWESHRHSVMARSVIRVNRRDVTMIAAATPDHPLAWP